MQIGSGNNANYSYLKQRKDTLNFCKLTVKTKEVIDIGKDARLLVTDNLDTLKTMTTNHKLIIDGVSTYYLEVKCRPTYKSIKSAKKTLKQDKNEINIVLVNLNISGNEPINQISKQLNTSSNKSQNSEIKIGFLSRLATYFESIIYKDKFTSTVDVEKFDDEHLIEAAEKSIKTNDEFIYRYLRDRTLNKMMKAELKRKNVTCK